MEYVFTFSLSQMVGAILAICAGVVTITKAVEALASWWKKAKKPEEDQNQRLALIESRLTKLETKEELDHSHLEDLDEGNRVTQQALLALLGHAIDGNNQTQLEHARDDLHKYLVER